MLRCRPLMPSNVTIRRQATYLVLARGAELAVIATQSSPVDVGGEQSSSNITFRSDASTSGLVWGRGLRQESRISRGRTVVVLGNGNR